MLYTHFCTRYEHSDHVEPVLVAGSSMAGYPDQG